MPGPHEQDPADDRPITFVVTGQPLAGGVAAASRGRAAGPSAGVQALPGRVKAAVRVGALRSAGEPQRLVAVPGEDVVALHITGGPVLVLHPAHARDLLLAQAAAAPTRGKAPAAPKVGEGAPPSEVRVTAPLRWHGQEAGSTTRGLLGDVVLGAIEVITGLVKDQAVALAASQVVQHVDAQVDAGLYALAPESLGKLKGQGRKVTPQHPIAPAAQPLLVLIHGTFVETTSTFGKLWALHPGLVRTLFAHYGNQVYALDHETLGKSPIANALTLVEALPAGAQLHLVTHSRGGLVAEVLARLAHQRTVGDADLAFFPGPEYAQHRQDLQALAAAMAAKNISVERVVRVACPARGTLLASRRLDAYLSVLKWSIEASGVPLVPEFVDFLAEVARRRASPEEVPGLAAMMPATPLVDWLNAAPEKIAGQLRVVAGDLQGDSVGSWIKTLLADAYYWTDNDIVVQTRSMYGGAPRIDGASFVLDRGGKTTHFAYFANPGTAQAVVDALTQPQPPGFAPIGPLSWAGQHAGGVRGVQRDPSRPAVFVLPGILGSHLKAGGRRVWLSANLLGNLDALAWQADGADGVEPDGPIGQVYDALIEHLGGTHEVLPFAFDWRRPLEEEARRLGAAVQAALLARQTTRQPVRIVAHSMGGLLARTMQLECPEVWQRMLAHEGARVLMLGTPNGGSYAPMQVLSGDDTFGNALAAFGSPLRDHHARQLMAAMPGFLQLQAGLARGAGQLGEQATWAQLADDDYRRTQERNWWHRSAGEAMEAAYQWGVPTQPVLDAALALRERLDAQREGSLGDAAGRLLLVVGHARSTPVGYEVTDEQGFVYLESADGDGRVPLPSALLPGVKTWTLDCEHGALPSARGAFDAYVELLELGTTERLAPLAPAAATRGAGAEAAPRRSRPGRQRLAAPPPPSQNAVFSVNGHGADQARPTAGAALQVAVLNGNLSFVSEPLLVGHYRSTELTGTEAVVNRLLGGAMAAALGAGIYPEDRGTHRVFVNAWRDPANPWALPRPRAVLVLGLGDEGGLRESELTAGVCQAVVGWSQRLAEEHGRAGASTRLAATLLGSGGLGVSASAAARAIARGVREANLRLAAIGWPMVSRLTLVELFLDRATEAWQGLQVLAAASPEAFALAPQIASGTGGLRQQLSGGYRGTDYDLITAVARKEGMIEFALDSRRARTELREQPTQIGLVREWVLKAATDRNDDPGIGRRLYQLLVPLEMRPFLGGTDRMMLDLDRATAAIPWELLDAGEAAGGSDRRPWAIRARLLRRLRKTSFRATPRDADAEAHVLLIGEPKVDADAGYGPLPAARDEALAVQDVLTAAGLPYEHVLALVDEPDAATVVSGLLDRPWRIVHIAGHGESLADGGRGVVLNHGHFLGRAEIKAMDTVPELVFLNCCHLGAFTNEQVLAGNDPSAFAAGIAEELIGLGVRCVVAAGWAVNDAPAQTFSRSFYAALMRPDTPFIDAVSEAREACWRLAPHGKTWAAYQCYGDPNWVFRRNSGDAQAPRAEGDEFAGVASPVALALALETLAVQSRYMGKAASEQREKLRQLQARFGAAWAGMGAVAEAFGVAWEAAGGRDEAIDWLDQAVQANDGSASLRAEQTLENLRARRAWDRASKQAAHAAAATGAGERAAVKRGADGAIVRALQGLEALARQRPNAERLNLLGSAYKRLALIERQACRDERATRRAATAEERALRAALAAYRRALQLGARTGVADVFYPALNCMAIELVLARLGRRPPRVTAATRSTARASLQAKSRQDPDFWSQVGLAELALYDALAAGRLVRDAKTVAHAWSDVHERVDNRSWWSSVADQADLVLGAWMHHGGNAAERDAAAALWAQVSGYAGRGLREPPAHAPAHTRPHGPLASRARPVTLQHAKPPTPQPMAPSMPAEAAAPEPTLGGASGSHPRRLGLFSLDNALFETTLSRGREPLAAPAEPVEPSATAAPASPGAAPPAALPASAPRAMPTPEAEPVDAAVFCPPRVARASSFLVQVFLYPPPQAAEAAARAHETDATAERRQSWSLPLDLAPGTRVDLHLDMPGLTVAEPDAVIVWRGRIANESFEVSVPAGATGDASGNLIGRLRLAIDGIPVGTMRFQVAIVPAGAPAAAPDARPTEAERYRQAFVSYASKDRAEVLRRVQAFKIAGLKVFQDVLELDPGERWEKRLYEEIDRCDVFFLFWSKAARESTWVGKEIDYALARKAGQDERPPAIQPVPIEGPPIVPPPESLRGLHFNDALLPHIAAADASHQAALDALHGVPAAPPHQP